MYSFITFSLAQTNKGRASDSGIIGVPQVCWGWNQVFHMPELWRCFEFELNQPASSYLKATHPDLIKQIIKRHSNHLQYVSFKVERICD